MKSYNNEADNKKMSLISLIDENYMKLSLVKKHFIFLLDESGSMVSTKRWNQLQEAYKCFIDSRIKLQSIDYVSVVTFNLEAYLHEPSRISVMETNRNLGIAKGCGTKFTPPFTIAEKLVSKENDAQPIIIFMSDGEAEDPTAYIEKKLMNPFRKKGLKIYSIAFGSNKLDILNKIASVGGTQAAKRAEDGIELTTIFEEIAIADSRVLNELVNRLAENVNKEIGNKLILEYF